MSHFTYDDSACISFHTIFLFYASLLSSISTVLLGVDLVFVTAVKSSSIAPIFFFSFLYGLRPWCDSSRRSSMYPKSKDLAKVCFSSIGLLRALAKGFKATEGGRLLSSTYKDVGNYAYIYKYKRMYFELLDSK